MATINLGAIKFNWRGAYNNATAYAVDDVVSSGGSSYICILASTGNAVSNGTYWQQMSAAGTNGTDLTTTLTTQGDILYRDGSGLQRLAKPTSDKILQNTSGGVVSWIDAPSGKIKKITTYENATRLSSSASSGDSLHWNWTTSFVKDAASTKLLIRAVNPTHNHSQGSQQLMQRFLHTDSTETHFYGAREYTYTGQTNSVFMACHGVLTGMKAGTYTVSNCTTSRGNNHNGGHVFNPNSNEDSRYEYGTDVQGNIHGDIDGSKSFIIIQEIE